MAGWEQGGNDWTAVLPAVLTGEEGTARVFFTIGSSMTADPGEVQFSSKSSKIN